jgi:hypothetical protein
MLIIKLIMLISQKKKMKQIYHILMITIKRKVRKHAQVEFQNSCISLTVDTLR